MSTDFTTLTNKIKRVGNKILSFAPKKSVDYAAKIYQIDESYGDNYSKDRFKNLYESVINNPMDLYRKTTAANVQPIVEDDKKYNIIDGAHLLFKECLDYNHNARLSYALSVSYMMGHIEQEFCRIPSSGLNLEKAIDQAKRSPVIFLIKNYFTVLVRFAVLSFATYQATDTFAAPIVYGGVFWIAFSIIFWNILLIIKILFKKQNPTNIETD